MTYLVTGGLGFIGSTFVKHILENDSSSKVIVLDALTYAGNLANLDRYLKNAKIIYPTKRGDLKNVVLFSDGSGLAESISLLSDNSKRIERKLSGYRPEIPSDRSVEYEVQVAFTGSSSIDFYPSRLVVVVGSIIDDKLVDSLVSLCDVIVNFAAETHVDRSIMNPDEFIKTNVYGTYVLLEAAKKKENIEKFVHISTDEVYGVATEKNFSETDPTNPRNPYSASKAAADRLVYAYNQTYGLPVNIVRPSNNFGPNQYPEKLIPVMIIKALRGEKLPIYGDGRQIRDWLFARDTVKAVDLVIEKGKVGDVYNIAGRNERENIEVVKEILKRLDKPESLINYVQDRPGHDRRYSLDDSKLRNELGFESSESFESNLTKTIDWYVENQEWWQKILEEDKEYKAFMKEWYKNR